MISVTAVSIPIIIINPYTRCAMIFRQPRRADSHNSYLTADNVASTRYDVVQVPYHLLLKLQLARFRPLLKGDYGQNENSRFVHNGCPISFDVSSDCHTFMVSAPTYRVSENDNQELLQAKYLELEQELVDIRLEWNEEHEITLFQNLPICLVQEDCLGEFQTILGRFLKERAMVTTKLQLVSLRERTITKKSSSQKLLSLRNMFGGRAA